MCEGRDLVGDGDVLFGCLVLVIMVELLVVVWWCVLKVLFIGDCYVY